VKIFESAPAAIAGIESGQSIAVGGFGLCGSPVALIDALVEHSVADGLHIVTNNCGPAGSALTRLLETGRVGTVTASYIGDNRIFLERYTGGSIAVDLIPQGTLAERLRCGGAGIPAFCTPTGVGTAIETGDIPRRYGSNGQVIVAGEQRPPIVINGVRCVLETGMTVDHALIRAETADAMGNLRFRGTARNFNPLCAMAARHAITEVQRVVEPGELAPDDIHLPCVFVAAVLDLKSRMTKAIERWTPSATASKGGPQ
jgi:3-oxoacid CoA-transferase subunit A